MKQKHIDKIRSFNRFYTRLLGVLNRRYMGSSFCLPEIRVIQDIFLHPDRSAKEICVELNMDKGYLSRILKKLEQQGYICRTTSEVDGRRDVISLTESGVVIYHELNESADTSVRDIYGGLTEDEQLSLISHMEAISRLLVKRNYK
jgi:putative acetyltransferase